MRPENRRRTNHRVMSAAKHNGASRPEVSYTTPVDPPLSRSLSNACNRFLMSRGLWVGRKFGIPPGKLKEPDLTLITKSKRVPGRRAKPD